MSRKAKARAPSPTPSESDSGSDIPIEAPTEINPYVVLGLAKTATADETKSAYRKAALRSHPDKAGPDQKEEAHKKFQEIAFAYAILSDDTRRKRYDTTGNTSETLDDDDFDWLDFFRSQKAETVSASQIEAFKLEYQGSEEEATDVLQVYTDFEGDMNVIHEKIMCSSVLEDDERFRKIIDEAIKAGKVEKYQRYMKEGRAQREKRLKKAKAEEAEAFEMAEELGLNNRPSEKSQSGQKTDLGSLQSIIQARQQGRAESLFDRLEAKYGGGSRGSKSKRKVDEPPEDAFKKNAKKSKG